MERLAAVQAELGALKTAREAVAGEALATLGRYTPFPIASWAARLAFGLPQRDIVTVTTNVPGPRQPLYGMGRRVLEIIPYVPIATTLRTGVSIFTYCGNVTFGITGDFATSPDLDVLAHGIEDSLAELLAAAQGRREWARERGRAQRRGRARRTKASPKTKASPGTKASPKAKAKASPATKASPVRRPPRPGT